jgi:hypothetical protein
LAPIIKKALTLQEYRNDDWIEVVERMTSILTTLCQQKYFTDDQIVIVGIKIDEWTV